MPNKPHQTTAELIEDKTLEIVAREGRDPRCLRGCIVRGKKCPPSFCEVVYQSVRRSMQNV